MTHERVSLAQTATWSQQHQRTAKKQISLVAADRKQQKKKKKNTPMSGWHVDKGCYFSDTTIKVTIKVIWRYGGIVDVMI